MNTQKTLLILGMISGLALAEGNLPLSYNAQNVNEFYRYQSGSGQAFAGPQYGGANGLAQQRLGGILTQDQYGYDLSATGGRDYKAQQGSNDANAGAAFAAGAGATMIATGVPMSMSLFIPEAVAGTQLITMGLIELMQAMASGQAANLNQGQNAYYLKDADNQLRDGLASSNPDHRREVEQILNTPGFRNYLSGRGINPDAFQQDFLNGNIPPSEEGIQNYLGYNPGDFSAGEFAKGKEIALAKYGELKAIDNTLDYADTDLSDKFGASGALVNVPNSPTGELDLDIGKTPEAAVDEGTAAGVVAHATGSKGTQKAPGGPAIPGADQFALPGFLKGKGKPKLAFGGLTKGQLLALGIESARPKQNIFFLAHRHYRSYRNWRDKPAK